MSSKGTTTTTTEPFVIKTWDNITPEQYEITPFTAGWPWCEPGYFPISYEWEAACVPDDPCQDTNIDGEWRTLWGVEECDPLNVVAVVNVSAREPLNVTTTSIVSIADPPMLPSTGLDGSMVFLAGALLCVGLALWILARH